MKKVREGIYNDEFHPFSTFAGIGYVAFLMNQISDEIKELIPFSSQVNELLANNVKNFWLIIKIMKIFPILIMN